MMTHLEVAQFVIDVFEAGIYDTPFLGGFYIEQEHASCWWILTPII